MSKTTVEISAFIPAVKIPQADGSVIVKPGKPVVHAGQDEIGTAEFARLVGLSQRHIQTLIEQGHIQARRPGAPRGKYKIPVSQLADRLKPAA